MFLLVCREFVICYLRLLLGWLLFVVFCLLSLRGLSSAVCLFCCESIVVCRLFLGWSLFVVCCLLSGCGLLCVACSSSVFYGM